MLLRLGQVTKHALAGRVVDARNPGRNFTKAEQTVHLMTEDYADEVREFLRIDQA